MCPKHCHLLSLTSLLCLSKEVWIRCEELWVCYQDEAMFPLPTGLVIYSTQHHQGDGCPPGCSTLWLWPYSMHMWCTTKYVLMSKVSSKPWSSWNLPAHLPESSAKSRPPTTTQIPCTEIVPPCMRYFFRAASSKNRGNIAYVHYVYPLLAA